MEEEKQYKKGLWTEEEDRVLMEYVRVNGKGQWNRIPKITGLRRCGKSCRLRWLNYLSPNVKRGDFTEEEEDLIIRLHNLLGNRWSLIAGRVPGRTDNQVKNHWNTRLRKKLGVRKANLKPSSKPHSANATVEEDSLSLPSNSDHSTLQQHSNNGVEDNPPHFSSVALDKLQEQCSNEPSTESFNCFSDHSPGMFEYLDGYRLDLLWQE